MPESATNMTLPGQEVSLLLDKATFKKDQNFMVAMESELVDETINIGDQVNFHRQIDPTKKEWAGVGMVTHIMTCYLLDLPVFIMSKHQDPEFKNPMALYHHLQERVGRLLNPTDKVISIGFTMIHEQ
jgi:hypothetical protein